MSTDLYCDLLLKVLIELVKI